MGDVLKVAPHHMRRKPLLDRLPYGVGCEVGVWKGDFSVQLLKAASELHLVDPWMSRPDRTAEWYAIPQADMDEIHQSVVDRFAGDPRVHVHRLASPAAADEFPDRWFDWVYIDGDHHYQAVKADLEAWWPKVKPEGLLCGDDYTTREWWGDGIVRAVNEHAAAVGRGFTDAGGQWWMVR